MFPRDAGIVRLGGEEVAPRSAKAALQAGIATVYQEVNLLPNLSVAQNLFLDRQPMRFGIVREGEMRRRAKALLTDFGLDIDVAAPLGSYSVAIQQVVAIARAVDLSARVLILDEPTSSLDRHEVEMLFGIMRQLAERGIGDRLRHATSSTRSTRSPTASRCCATAGWSASARPPRCRGSS